MDGQPPQQIQPASPQVTPQRTLPDSGIAVILEVLPGIALQTFGVGNIYAGNVAGGVLMMIGYWVTCVVNFLLCLILVGFITWPLTWAAFMILSSIMASNAAKARAAGR